MSTVPDHPDLPAAALQRIDDVCSRFEAAWTSDETPDIADHFVPIGESDAAISAEFTSRLFRELLLADVEQRTSRGLPITADSYLHRFPQHADDIRAVLASAAPRDDTPAELLSPSAAAAEAAAAAGRAAASGTEHLLPKRLGVYERGPCIGRGGMGVVYRARDTRLGRDVAIKILARRCLNAPDLVKRFQREAAAVARLAHPNIVVLHDIGCEQIDGLGMMPFVVMELLEGQSLRQLLKRPVAATEAIRIAATVADALAAAHQRGVIHRDIKPENIFLTRGQQVKVLDFGLAKTLFDVETDDPAGSPDDAHHLTTQEGRILGTYGYMAPEQVVGGAATTASDLFALTCVLFELLTGIQAFSGRSSTEVASATLRDNPLEPDRPFPHVAAVLERLPTALVELLDAGFQKESEQRLSSAAEYAERLNHVRANWDTLPTRPRQRTQGAVPAAAVATARRIGRRRTVPAIVAAVCALVIAGYGVSRRNSASNIPGNAQATATVPLVSAGIGEVSRPTLDDTTAVFAPKSVAVLPFATAADDDARLVASGLTVSLTNRLSHFADLEVRPFGSSVMYDETGDEPRNLPRISRQLQVSWLVTGTLEFLGSQVSVFVELVDGQKHQTRWSHQFSTTQNELLVAQELIAKEIARQLDATPASSSSESPARAPTTNLEAYREYILGQVNWSERRPDSVQSAEAHYRRAVELDSSFAEAWAGIAQCCIVQAERDLAPRHEALSKAEAAIRQALAIDPQSVDAIAARAMMAFEFRWQFEDAQRDFETALRLMPNHVTSHQWYSELLSATGQHDSAISQAGRALQLDPQSAIAAAIVGRNLFKAGRLEDAIDQFQTTLQRHPDFDRARGYLIEAFEETDDLSAAIEQWRILSRGDSVVATLDEAYRLDGSTGYWQARLDDADRLGKVHPVSRVFLAGIHARIGGSEHADAAFEILNDAYEDRSPALAANLLVHPALVRLQFDERYVRLLQQIGLSSARQ